MSDRYAIQICHTQLCHSQLRHTKICRAQTCHTQISHTHICHSQLCHTQICQTDMSDRYVRQICHTQASPRFPREIWPHVLQMLASKTFWASQGGAAEGVDIGLPPLSSRNMASCSPNASQQSILGLPRGCGGGGGHRPPPVFLEKYGLMFSKC